MTGRLRAVLSVAIAVEVADWQRANNLVVLGDAAYFDAQYLVTLFFHIFEN